MSSNISYSERSMNGIISIFSEDIQVNTLDANTINVDDININNSLNVNNVTLSPQEVSQLSGINTNQTIQEQIDDINGDLNNVVTITGNQTIIGSKTFSTTTEQNGVLLLRNNLNVNNINISPTELSYLDGATSNLQEQINQAVVGVTLGTDQVISGFKAFINGIQTPFIENQDVTGTVNGFFYDNYNLLYTSYTGTYTLNVSQLTGIDSTNNIISAFDTVNNVVTVTTALTPKSSIYTLESYKPQDATTEIFVWGGTSNLAQNQGVIFNSLIDFIDVINTDSYLPLNATSITTSYIGDIQGYISSGQLITPDLVTLDNFFEGNGMIRPVVVRDQFPVVTNSYLLASPNTITDEPIKSSPLGFIKNNNFWLRASYSLADNNFVEGSITTVPTGCQIINANVDSYQYTIAVSDSPSYLSRTGFVTGGTLRIYDTTGIILLTGLYNITDNDEYGIVSNISGAIVSILKGILINDTFTTFNAYINSNLDLVCLTDNVGKFSSEFTISRIDGRIGSTDVYNISSPSTISATTPQIKQYSYKYDANTLILENNSGIIGSFFFEFPTLSAGSNQYGSFSTTTDKVNTIINSNYVSPAITGSSAVIFSYASTQLIYFGNTTSPGINKFVVNANLAPYTSVAFTQNLTSTYIQSYNGLIIVGKNGSLTETTPLINNVPYVVASIGGTIKFIIGSTIVADVNDITKGSSIFFNMALTGRYITSKVQSASTSISGLYTYTLNYTPTVQNAKLTGLSWSQAKNSSIIVASNNSLVLVGDFVSYDGGVWGYITNKNVVGSNMELTVNTFAFGALSGNDLNIYDDSGFLSVFEPQSFNSYNPIQCNIYEDTQDFFDQKTYDFYNLETNDVYENRTYGQYQNANSNIYSNNLYNIDTTVQIDLPNTGVPDTFVVENLAQNLSNKTFTDDTTFQQDIDVVDVRATGNIDCVDLTATGNIDCVNITGTGLLTLSDDTKEHIISNNLYIGRLFSATSNNYGLAIGGTSWTDPNTNNTFVLTKNVSNNITVVNSPSEVWTNINNSLRLKVANEVIEFYFAGNSRFSSNNASTRLYRTNNNSGADVFANDNNIFMDFFTLNKDYDVRLQFQRRDSADGTGWFDCFAYRGRFWTGTQKMLEWGYINSANSFLMGASGATWIQFNTNTEIYYQVNNANRFTMAYNGYHYATLHVNTSDRRLKSNIVDVNNALQTINKLKVKEFDKKCSLCCDDDECETSHEIGFIAQEVEETEMSFCVTSTLQNDTKGLKDSCIFSLNVKATQELYQMVISLQEEVKTLKEKLSYLNV
jgi:hypothetical protein